MFSLLRGFVRTSAFWRKEIVEVIRQPRLIFMLVLGPFLILLIFGLGYQNKPPTFRTVFVAPTNSTISEHIQDYVAALGSNFIFAGVTDNEQQAMQRLQRGEVDLVAVAPTDAEEKLKRNQQAQFTIYQNELDPFQANWARYYAYVYVNEVNRRLLTSLVGQGKTDVSKVKTDLETARANVKAVREALTRGDQASANQKQQELSNNVDVLTLAIGAGATLLGGVQKTVGAPPSQQPAAERPLNALDDLRQNLNDLASAGGDSRTRIAKLDQIDKDLTQIDSELGTYEKVDPIVLVSPFTNEVKSTLPVEITPTDFFAPAVLALLLQHLALTLAALSIVRERTLGTIELFRVAPLSALEALIGKYLSYLLFCAVIGAALLLLSVYVLHVPMLGDWTMLAAIFLGMIFTSLSIGFVISLISQTDSQAVQYTMLMLIASVFFSGFIMSLESLLPPVRVISGLLPTTYGIILLRDNMLRGALADPILLTLLFSLGMVLFFFAWLLMHRTISRAQS